MDDMMRDLMESVMDEAATCADSIRRVIIDSGAIMTGAVLSIIGSRECDRDRPGFGEDSISQKLSPIIVYIVVQLLGQFSKETIHKTASS